MFAGLIPGYVDGIFYIHEKDNFGIVRLHYRSVDHRSVDHRSLDHRVVDQLIIDR